MCVYRFHKYRDSLIVGIYVMCLNKTRIVRLLEIFSCRKEWVKLVRLIRMPRSLCLNFNDRKCHICANAMLRNCLIYHFHAAKRFFVFNVFLFLNVFII